MRSSPASISAAEGLRPSAARGSRSPDWPSSPRPGPDEELGDHVAGPERGHVAGGEHQCGAGVTLGVGVGGGLAEHEREGVTPRFIQTSAVVWGKVTRSKAPAGKTRTLSARRPSPGSARGCRACRSCRWRAARHGRGGPCAEGADTGDSSSPASVDPRRRSPWPRRRPANQSSCAATGVHDTAHRRSRPRPPASVSAQPGVRASGDRGDDLIERALVEGPCVGGGRAALDLGGPGCPSVPPPLGS